MRTAAICPTCATFENALCVLYNGPYLANIDVNTIDPSVLRGAYRRVYPKSIEYIKGGGKTYVVEGSGYAYDPGLIGDNDAG